MTSLRGLLLVLLSVGIATPVAATLNNSEQPGSVLVFPKFIRGTFNDLTGESRQAVHAITEIEISVVCPRDQTCGRDPITGKFDKVFMRAHWVCPGCNETSFDLQTTINGSLYFNPEGVTAIGGVVTASVFPSNATTTIAAPPCERGYLIVWVTDGSGNPIKFDGLIGDAIIRRGALVAGTCSATFPCLARSYNAIPIQASENLAPGDSTDVNGDGSLNFDGSGYQMVTGKIIGTVRYENSTPPQGNVMTDLTLLTLDVASNRPNPATNVGLNFYTADEDLLDTATSFTCWSEQQLTTINPSLTTQRMGRKGLVESTFAEQQVDPFTVNPVTLLGIIETIESDPLLQSRDFAYSLFNDGNPVPTTFRP